MSLSPRPILKHNSTPSSTSGSGAPAVHFPPSPSLTRTFPAHSPAFYDRSPIVVAPNTCELPERGCPGRTYSLDEGPPGTAYAGMPKPVKTRHPKAFSNPSASKATYPVYPPPPSTLPLLVPDVSSESDESDGFLSPLPPSMSMSATATYRSGPGPSAHSLSSSASSSLSLSSSSSFSTHNDRYPPPQTAYPNYQATNVYPSHHPSSGVYSMPPGSAPGHAYPSYPHPPINHHSYPSSSSLAAQPQPLPYDPPPETKRKAQVQAQARRGVRRTSSPSPNSAYLHVGGEDEDPGYDDDADISTPMAGTPPSPTARTRRFKGREHSRERRERESSGKRFSLTRSMASFSLRDGVEHDGGCLGGF